VPRPGAYRALRRVSTGRSQLRRAGCEVLLASLSPAGPLLKAVPRGESGPRRGDSADLRPLRRSARPGRGHLVGQRRAPGSGDVNGGHILYVYDGGLHYEYNYKGTRNRSSGTLPAGAIQELGVGVVMTSERRARTERACNRRVGWRWSGGRRSLPGRDVPRSGGCEGGGAWLGGAPGVTFGRGRCCGVRLDASLHLQGGNPALTK